MIITDLSQDICAGTAAASVADMAMGLGTSAEALAPCSTCSSAKGASASCPKAAAAAAKAAANATPPRLPFMNRPAARQRERRLRFTAVDNARTLFQTALFTFCLHFHFRPSETVFPLLFVNRVKSLHPVFIKAYVIVFDQIARAQRYYALRPLQTAFKFLRTLRFGLHRPSRL